MTYPFEFRRHVLAVRKQEGLTFLQVAERFCVGIASVTRWAKEPEPKRTRIKPWTKIDMVELARDIREYPDAYHYERALRLEASTRGICDAMRRLGQTRKKRPCTTPEPTPLHGKILRRK
jgi:hypothetical protein